MPTLSPAQLEALDEDAVLFSEFLSLHPEIITPTEDVTDEEFYEVEALYTAWLYAHGKEPCLV